MSTLRKLKTFVAVAEYKKMSIAAKKLYLAQPTVSQIITDLEKEYQIELFERTNKELKITPAGEILLASAREIISIQENLEISIKNIKHQRPLKVGATLTIGDTFMGNLVSNLKEKYPDIDISVLVDNTKNLEDKLLHNKLDIAFVEGIISKEEILSDPLMEDQLVIICGKKHPFSATPILSLEHFRSQEFILREKGSGTRAIFENIMLSHRIPFQIKWECNSNTAILDAVKHNLGLGVISLRSVQTSLLKEEISLCQIDSLSMKRYFYLCYHKNHPLSSQMKDFITEIKQTPSA